MAEWLRRWTRNPLGSPRAGSNPADYVVEGSFEVIKSVSLLFYIVIDLHVNSRSWSKNNYQFILSHKLNFCQQ